MIVNWIKSKLIIILSTLLVCSALVGSVATKLYLESQKDLTSLTEQYKSLQRDYGELVESKDKLTESCEVTKKSLRDVLVKLGNIETTTTTSVTGIETYKPKCVQPKITSVEEGVLNEIEYVDIDAPLDPEFIRLSESSLSN
jgi:chromosome segregation ATPase